MGRAKSIRPASQEPRAHALRGQIGESRADRLAEDLHQLRHLVRRPGSVLGRERVDGQRADAEVDGRLDGAAKRPSASRAARCRRQAVSPSARCRP